MRDCSKSITGGGCVEAFTGDGDQIFLGHLLVRVCPYFTNIPSGGGGGAKMAIENI